MRVLITGSRQWRDVDTISSVMNLLPKGSTIVHGAASGADAIAHSLALYRGHTPEPHWPNYALHPPHLAPLKRNQLMIELGADLCLAFPTAQSRGTWACVRDTKDAGIPTIVVKSLGGLWEAAEWLDDREEVREDD